jgi:hypothetical protein
LHSGLCGRYFSDPRQITDWSNTVAKQKPTKPAKTKPVSSEPDQVASETESITSETIYKNNKAVIDEALKNCTGHLNDLSMLVAMEIIRRLPDYYVEHGVTRQEKNAKRRKTKPKPGGGSPLNW